MTPFVSLIIRGLWNMVSRSKYGFYPACSFRSSASSFAAFNWRSISFSANCSILVTREERITSEILLFSFFATSHSCWYIVWGNLTAHVISLCSLPRPKSFLVFFMVCFIVVLLLGKRISKDTVFMLMYIGCYTNANIFCIFYLTGFFTLKALHYSTEVNNLLPISCITLSHDVEHCYAKDYTD